MRLDTICTRLVAVTTPSGCTSISAQDRGHGPAARQRRAEVSRAGFAGTQCLVDQMQERDAVADLAKRIPGAVVRPLASPYGHRAGDPQRPGMEAEREWLRGAVSRFREEGGG